MQPMVYTNARCSRSSRHQWLMHQAWATARSEAMFLKPAPCSLVLSHGCSHQHAV